MFADNKKAPSGAFLLSANAFETALSFTNAGLTDL